MTTDVAPSGWYPAPNGAPELWYWDGQQWIDPVENVQEQITELIIPHLERMYRKGLREGFEAGFKAAEAIEIQPQVGLQQVERRRASHVLGQFGVSRDYDWTPK